MTADPASLHLRAGKRGQVHDVRIDEPTVARCGVLVEHGELTNEAVTCKTCLGTRVWRGRHSVQHRPGEEVLTDELRRHDLRRTDAALLRLEHVNAAAYDRWIIANGIVAHAGHRPTPAAADYPEPDQLTADLVRDLERRYERRERVSAIRNTVTAHEELLRLQQYLLPDCDPED